MDKAADAFRTISEVAEELGIQQHVLRFWETKFSQIRPLKRGGGRRYYRPDDVDLLRGIRYLLYGQGYTIKGVQRLHKEQGVSRLVSAGSGEAPPSMLKGSAPRPLLGEGARSRLASALGDLEGVKARLDALLASGDS